MSNYNSLAELSVFVLSLVVIFVAWMAGSFREKKQIYFLLSDISILVSTLLNIISIDRIVNFNPDKILSSTIITSVYFFWLGLIPFFFSLYCYEFVSVAKEHKKIFYTSLSIPLVVYFIIYLLNPFYGLIFRYDAELGYVRGSCKMIAYICTVIYAIILLFAVIKNRANLSKKKKIVFVVYPILGLVISGIQFITTYSVMVGTSSFATLLLVYLTVQGDMLEVDFLTGLLNGKSLESTVDKKLKGDFAVISIENYSDLESRLSTYNFNALIISISQRLGKLFPHSAYYLTANRFAVLGKDYDSLKQNIDSLLREFEYFKTEDNTEHNVDFLVAGVDLEKNADSYKSAMVIINNLFSTARKKKNQKFIFCDENYVVESKRRQNIYEILDRELNVNSEQFQVYFQPIYSISKKKFIYAEALSRLFGTELGDINPGEFVSIAEEKGLIERLGNTVFEKVCDFISKNKDKVHAISVNFSVYQLVNPNVVDYVLNTIEKFGIMPENIIIEMTESIFVDDFNTIRDHMIKLSKAGIVFYLDDFGTGYSNFANVIALPFKTIKIDRSFVLAMETNEELARLTMSIIHTFKENGLKILVEGVETEKQDEMIKRADTDYIQGFLYSRPVKAAEFLSLIA